jgi:glycosyltransferase involved in cell wall biosynthesis
MKVINIIEEGRVGGPQLRILQVTPLLQTQGVDTTVIIPQNNSSDFQNRLIESGIPYYTTPLTTLQKHPKKLFYYLLNFIPELFILFKLFRNLMPDIIHVSGGSWQIKGLLAGRLAGSKVIWHLNDTKVHAVIMIIFRLIQNLSHAFITSGHRVQEYYLPHEKKRPIFNISAPVDCTFFNQELIKKTHTKDSQRIVTIININPNKDLKTFIEAAEILNKKSSRVLEFRIVGCVYESQKKYYENLKNLEKKLNLNNLVFVGGVEDIRYELINADIYVCTSLAEASPTSVWEAMAMAKPIVSTNVGEVDIMIEDGVSGHIVNPRDSRTLAEKVITLLKRPNEAKLFGQNARKRAEELLDSRLIAQKHKHAYVTFLNYYKAVK